MAKATKPVNNANASNPTPLTATFAKSLADVSKIEVFIGQNFCHWQEHIHTLWICIELSSLFPLPNLMPLLMPINFNNGFRPIMYVITLYSLILKYISEDVVKQIFIISNYYCWTMNKEKDIKVQINEYHKLLEDLKTENISLPDEFVFELLIEKLLESLTNYKQHLKHRHK
ncbi:hypothetical protein GYH30_003477 [Glycine max]|uniref:Uncharacterized protein n=1 Tax=Glycine max TaxID=3847 RepID=A0A0R0KUI1_SOYBN|nr:hypothetical protein GYH30_003477 [Glycine max]